MHNRLLLILVTLVASLPLASSANVPAQAPPCVRLSDPVFQRLNPGTGAGLLTTRRAEANRAELAGFTTDLGAGFQVLARAKPGLVAVHRLANPASADQAFESAEARIVRLKSSGYVDEGVVFFAAERAATGCGLPILRLTRQGKHRYFAGHIPVEWEREGWRLDGVAFYAAAYESHFGFAVMPDTQLESHDRADPRMGKRISWLIANKDELDLRWVLHTGDVQDWDSPGHPQYVNNSTWLSRLPAAGLPFLAAVGNHDTNAVCAGGGACPGMDAREQVRNTAVWNRFYPPSRFGYEGTFQPGKSDNGFRTFSAAGLDWLVLVVELWPRQRVIDWAQTVIASHPRHNVIVVTHCFLGADLRISNWDGGYGATAPTTFWQMLTQYPNVQFVFSGHVGMAGHRVINAHDGHRVVAFLGALHDRDRNPVRTVDIDAATGVVTSKIQASWDASQVGQEGNGHAYPQYDVTVDAMTFVR